MAITITFAVINTKHACLCRYDCMPALLHQGCTRQGALERQDFSCMCLAHHYDYQYKFDNIICETGKRWKAGLTRSTKFLGGFTSEMDLYSLNLNERRSCLNSLAKLSPPCTRIHILIPFFWVTLTQFLCQNLNLNDNCRSCLNSLAKLSSPCTRFRIFISFFGWLWDQFLCQTNEIRKSKSCQDEAHRQ